MRGVGWGCRGVSFAGRSGGQAFEPLTRGGFGWDVSSFATCTRLSDGGPAPGGSFVAHQDAANQDMINDFRRPKFPRRSARQRGCPGRTRTTPRNSLQPTLAGRRRQRV